MVIGRTGDGKSTLCNYLMKNLGCEETYFEESADGSSHTHDPKLWSYGEFTIADTPGLMDTEGIEKDSMNLIKIIACGYKI